MIHQLPMYVNNDKDVGRRVGESSNEEEVVIAIYIIALLNEK